MLRQRGFTLLEMLVSLIITAFTVTLLFQIVSGFARAHEVASRYESVQGNRSVMIGWFRDTVSGLIAVNPKTVAGATQAKDPEFGLRGDETHFTAITLSPLQRDEGMPTRITWRIEHAAGKRELVYLEQGRKPLPLATAMQPSRFLYLDDAGKAHRVWPPRLGNQAAMPDAIELVGTGQGSDSVVLQAVAVDVPVPLPAYSRDAEN